MIEKQKLQNAEVAVATVAPFDIYPVPSAKLADLSKSIFENEYLPASFASDVLEANDRTYESTNRIPNVYRESVLGEDCDKTVTPENDPYCLATINTTAA